MILLTLNVHKVDTIPKGFQDINFNYLELESNAVWLQL